MVPACWNSLDEAIVFLVVEVFGDVVFGHAWKKS